MSKEQLESLIRKVDKENQKNKQKRLALACLFFAFAYGILFFKMMGISDIGDFLALVVAALISSVVHVLLNTFVIGNMVLKGKDEDDYLKSLIREYEYKYKENIWL